MKLVTHGERQKRISKLISLCHFYKGETVPSYSLSPVDRICWQYEKEWAESLAESYRNRDRYVNYFKNRFNNQTLTYHLKVNMPKSLFAFFFLKCDTSPFVHEWIHAPFELMSERYSGNTADELMKDFLGL